MVHLSVSSEKTVQSEVLRILKMCIYLVVITEQITGLLMNSDRMTANVRFDYAHIWDEIKTFTKIDGDGVKLLLLSNCWNTVVGSFDALFVYANEKSFCRFLMFSFMKSGFHFFFFFIALSYAS